MQLINCCHCQDFLLECQKDVLLFCITIKKRRELNLSWIMNAHSHSFIFSHYVSIIIIIFFLYSQSLIQRLRCITNEERLVVFVAFLFEYINTFFCKNQLGEWMCLYSKRLFLIITHQRVLYNYTVNCPHWPLLIQQPSLVVRVKARWWCDERVKQLSLDFQSQFSPSYF